MSKYVRFWGFDFSLSAYWSDNFSRLMMVHWVPHKGFPLELYGKLPSRSSILDFVLCLMILCMIVVPIHIQYIHNLIWIELGLCKDFAISYPVHMWYYVQKVESILTPKNLYSFKTGIRISFIVRYGSGWGVRRLQKCKHTVLNMENWKPLLSAYLLSFI